MRNLAIGKKFCLTKELPHVRHQTISKRLSSKFDLSLFYMDEKTDISTELYFEYKFYLILEGEVLIAKNRLKVGDSLVCLPMEPFCIEAIKETIFLEITINLTEEKMKNLEKGRVIELKNMIDYVDGAISNLDIASTKNMKMMLMSFDANEGLKPHSAPGDALVVPLEGKARVMVGDEEFEIGEQEQIVFPKNIKHNVTAITKFKMMLILVID